MVEGKRPRKPTDLKLLASLRMLATGGSDQNIEDVSYIAEETKRQYFKSFCKDIVDM